MEALSPITLPLDLMRTPHLDEGVRQQKALKELEGVFLHLLIKEMRNSVPQNGLLGDSPAQKMFQEMLDEVYAQKMAESGQLGLAKIIADQIALQGDQQDIRKALSEARSGDPFRLDTKTGPPVFLDLPQVRSRQAFIPVKSAPNPADMFPVDGLK